MAAPSADCRLVVVLLMLFEARGNLKVGLWTLGPSGSKSSRGHDVGGTMFRHLTISGDRGRAFQLGVTAMSEVGAGAEDR